MLMRSRILTLSLAAPLSLVAYHPLSALASGHAHASCDGVRANDVVTAHSPHKVFGTNHRDVIVIKVPGHVVNGLGGNDLICGSAGRDVINGGAGADTIFANGGNDTVEIGRAHV